MPDPCLTVVVTCYNRERTIAASVESVLASRFGDFELLVVDDRSDDATLEVARSLARRDPRIRVEANPRNLGQFANRNHAASLVRTEFFKYHDSDDLMYPHCLETMLGPLREEPRASFALSCGWAWEGGPCPMLLTPRLCYEREFLGRGIFFCGPAGALFRTRAFHELGGFEDRGVASDRWFWRRACRVASVLLVPADLFWYRTHPGQEIQSAAAAASYAAADGEDWRALSGADCPLPAAELEQARRNCAWTLFRLTLRDLRAGRTGLARLRLRSAGLSLGDWARYLRRPRREPMAGTPLDAAGDYLIPRWGTAAGPAAVSRT